MRRLVVAPHVDDDVLGCASVLLPGTAVLYCGVDAYHRVPHTARRVEANRVADATGVRHYWPVHHDAPPLPLFDGAGERSVYATERLVNAYDEASLRQDIEAAIRIECPDEVYIPWPSYNQDHRAVYAAALVALRPHDVNHLVPRVLVYEGSQINFWDHAHPARAFRPTLFMPIDFHRKRELYEMMPSQVREHRSVAHLEALCRLRGGEVGLPYAEAFEVLRWIGEP